MNARVVCACIVAVVAVVALLLLIYSLSGFSTTGATVQTRICPAESAPIISGEDFLVELERFEQQGYYCFFGYDGLTPCCVRPSQ